MATECPDLCSLSGPELEQFWSSNDPSKLKRVGDRLLAESLPTRQPRPGFEAKPGWLFTQRGACNLSLSQMAERLGVTPHLLASWEQGAIRPPESLIVLYRTLHKKSPVES